MLLRNSSTGGFQVYDISNNNITNSAFLGTVGLDWQVMGFGNFSSLGETDMLLRNVNTGGLRGLRYPQQPDHQRRVHGHGRARLAVLGCRQLQRRAWRKRSAI